MGISESYEYFHPTRQRVRIFDFLRSEIEASARTKASLGSTMQVSVNNLVVLKLQLALQYTCLCNNRPDYCDLRITSFLGYPGAVGSATRPGLTEEFLVRLQTL